MCRSMQKTYLTPHRKSNSLENQDLGDSEKIMIIEQPTWTKPSSVLFHFH